MYIFLKDLSVKDVQLSYFITHRDLHIDWDYLIKYDILWIEWTQKKVSVVQYFSDLLIAAAHHDAVVLRNVSLSSSDKPQHSSSTETIIKDDKVTLDCTVKANPAPTYTWDHLKEKNSSSVLQSSTLSPDYTCTATNTLGREQSVHRQIYRWVISEIKNHVRIICLFDSCKMLICSNDYFVCIWIRFHKC